MYRTPIIITTNKDVWHYSDADESAFKNRMFLYKMNQSGNIPPHSTSCIRKYYREYCEWLTTLSHYFTGCEPNCTGGPEYSPAENDSNDCRFHRELHQLSSDCDIICGGANLGASSGVNNKRRSSSDGSESIKCTKRSRPSIDDSTSTDDSKCSTRASAGDSPGRRGDIEEGFTLYSGDTTNRRGNRLGGVERLLGPDGIDGHSRSTDTNFGYNHKLLRQGCKLLCDFGRRYRSLEKIFRKSELSVQPGVDREILPVTDKTLFSVLNKDQWLTLIHIGFLCAKCENLI